MLVKRSWKRVLGARREDFSHRHEGMEDFGDVEDVDTDE